MVVLLLLPSILPTGTVYATLRLWKRLSEKNRNQWPYSAYLDADPLPAILAFDLLLDDRVITGPLVDPRDEEQGDHHNEEVDDLVDEGAEDAWARQIAKCRGLPNIPVSHDHRPIILGLLDGIVPLPFIVLRPATKNSKFLAQVAVDER